METATLKKHIRILYFLIITLLMTMVYGIYHIKKLSDKLPSYNELKEDAQGVKNSYESSKDRVIDYFKE